MPGFFPMAKESPWLFRKRLAYGVMLRRWSDSLASDYLRRRSIQDVPSLVTSAYSVNSFQLNYLHINAACADFLIASSSSIEVQFGKPTRVKE
jgi:hypothetical protein